MSGSEGSLRHTRRQIDELDLLLQRLLSLPVAAEPVPVTQPTEAVETEEDMSVLTPPPPTVVEEVVPHDIALEMPPTPILIDVPIHVPVAEEAEEFEEPPESILVRFRTLDEKLFDWANRPYDRLVAQLGRAGMPLATGLIPALLGWAGVGMIVLAVVWVVELRRG